jgi:hypothetical protein
MVTYGGFLFSFAVHLQAGLGDSALRAGLTFAPCAVAFGLCGYFWRRLPAGWHAHLTTVGCAVCAVGYALVAFDLRRGGTGGLPLQAFMLLIGVSLALAFSPLVTHALVRVPLHQAADASGLLTTAIQLSQAVGVAVFGSVFLTMGARGAAAASPGNAGAPEGTASPVGHAAPLGHLSEISGHALGVTLAWAAVTVAFGVAAAVPLARTVLAARRTAA